MFLLLLLEGQYSINQQLTHGSMDPVDVPTCFFGNIQTVGFTDPNKKKHDLRFASAIRKFEQVNSILADVNDGDDLPSSLTLRDNTWGLGQGRLGLVWLGPIAKVGSLKRGILCWMPCATRFL